MERKKIVIRKYENRRLYDSTNSRYVNLDEVAQMIRAGADVQVLDAVTGEDISRLILTQIIMEDAKDAGSAFPLDILRQMIIASGRASQEGALQYMKTVFDLYQNAYQAWTQPLAPFGFVRNAPAGAPPRPPAPEPPPPGRESRPAATGREEVEELRRRLEELESRMRPSGTTPKGRRKKR